MSLDNLVVLKCISVRKILAKDMPAANAVDMKLTPLGIELYHACNPDASD